MSATLANATLPQLITSYRSTLSVSKENMPDHLIRLTYQSTAIEGTSLVLPHVRTLIQNGGLIPNKPCADQWRMIDHHHALEQVLNMASQGDPINRIALQEVAATLMRQTGGPIHALLSQIDTSKGELRVDSSMAGRRVLVAAHKLPAAIDALLKGINTRLSQLKTPRQVYDLSFEAHFQLLSLHPFGAGNGPMARLLMTYIQHYQQLPLSLMYVENRTGYLVSLEASWQQKTAVPLVRFLHSQLIRLLTEDLDPLPDQPEADGA